MNLDHFSNKPHCKNLVVDIMPYDDVVIKLSNWILRVMTLAILDMFLNKFRFRNVKNKGPVVMGWELVR